MTKQRSEKIVSYANDLRNNMTKEESILWYKFLRNYQIKFTRQEVIDHYIADFYCPTVKLIVEIDGNSHYTEKAKKYDAERTVYLENHGMTVVRYSNGSVINSLDWVCDDIDRTVKRLLKNIKP